MTKSYKIEYWQLVFPCDCYDNKYAYISATSEEEALKIIRNDYQYRLGKKFKVIETTIKQ